MRTHLDRDVLLHVCKDKTLTYRRRGQPIFNGSALPVFSVDSEEEAEELVTLVGRKQYTDHPQIPGRPWMKITLDGELDFESELEYEHLPAVVDKLLNAYAHLKGLRQ